MQTFEHAFLVGGLLHLEVGGPHWGPLTLRHFWWLLMTAETALGTMLWKMHAWQIDPFYFWCGWTCQHGLSAKTKNCFSAFFMWNVAEQCFVNGFNANLCTSLVSILLCLQLPLIIRLTKVVFENITRWLCTGPLSQLTIWPHYQTISTDVVSNFMQI